MMTIGYQFQLKNLVYVLNYQSALLKKAIQILDFSSIVDKVSSNFFVNLTTTIC